MAKTSRASTSDVSGRNAADIRSLWAIGCESLQTCPQDTMKYGMSPEAIRKEIRRLEQTHGEKLPVALNIDTFKKMRRVASQYDEAAIAAIAKSVLKHRSPFSTTHMFRLLALQDRKKRTRLMQSALEQSWSVRRLREEIQACLGRRRAHVGRLPSMPQNRKAVLLTLHRQIESWRKWTMLAQQRLPEDIRTQVQQIDHLMLALSLTIVPATRPKD